MRNGARNCFLRSEFRHKLVEEFLAELASAPRAQNCLQIGDASYDAKRAGQILTEDERKRKAMGSSNGVRRKRLSVPRDYCDRQPCDSSARFPKEIAKDTAAGYGIALQRRKRYFERHGYL